jgi:hypothetical protein
MRLQWCAIALLAMACAAGTPGCILLTGDVYESAPDPDEKHFLRCTHVWGRTILIKPDRGGTRAAHEDRTAEVAGLDLTGMDCLQVQDFEDQMSNLVRQNIGLLLTDEADDRVSAMCALQPRLMWERFPGFPALILFPHVIKVPPQRLDLAEAMISTGMAKFMPSEIADEQARRHLAIAEAKARAGHLGIWAPMDVRMKQAIEARNLYRVQALLDMGFGVNTVTSDACTPLWYAMDGWGRTEILEFLISKGADVNIWLPNYGVPLGHAASRGYLRQARILLAAGADVNGRAGVPPAAAGDPGVTPLYLAVQGGQYEMVVLLVEHGADLNTPTSAGYTPLDLVAEAPAQKEVRDYLLAHGAKYGRKSPATTSSPSGK